MLYYGCGVDTTGEDTDPPAAPILIEKSSEIIVVETGIDAIPEWDWIRIEWRRGSEEDLAGYEIWRLWEDDTTENGEMNGFTQRDIVSLEELLPGESQYFYDQDPQVAPSTLTGFGRGYLYYLRAYDTEYNLSETSDTAYYKLLPKPINVYFDTTGTDTINCSYPFNPGVSFNYFIRVLRHPDNTVMWLKSEYNLADPFKAAYNNNGQAQPLTTGTYKLRIDVIPIYLDSPDIFPDVIRYSGGESKWYIFEIE